MKVGDLRVFNSQIGWYYSNRLFIVLYIDEDSAMVQISFPDTGFRDHWDRINLLHDSKPVPVKKCP